jgi:predicted NUDIX family NTP pyrophosphohydrolase
MMREQPGGNLWRTQSSGPWQVCSGLTTGELMPLGAELQPTES